MSLPEGHVARRLRITGRVQGVYYRGWTVDTARTLGLSGWVRNRHDGSVEILVVGAAGTVDLLIKACRSGPPAASVEAVEVEPAQGIVADGFVQKPTV